MKHPSIPTKRTNHPTCVVPGIKRSSPNDVTCIPESTDETQTPSKFYNDFEILQIIGTGSFGTVYRAKCLIDDEIYAIKRSIRQFRSEVDRNQMMREVHAMAALSSSETDDADAFSTIVKYYSAWVEDDFVCIQMEMCDSSIESLMLSSIVFQESEIFTLLRDTLLALKILHR